MCLLGRENAGVRACVCEWLVMKGMVGGGQHNLSITAVQEVVFKAVLVQTFCHVCFPFHLSRRVLFSMQMYYF